MASVLALISKSEFDKRSNHGKALSGLSITFHLDRYESSHPTLETLADGGDLFLVTVRPPKDDLWLIAIIAKARFSKGAWCGARNMVRATKITHLRDALRFANGQGISAKPGRLAMSLQTPRVLSPDDVKLLRAAAKGDTAAPPVTPTKAARAGKPARKGSVLSILMEAALTQLEDEYLDEARENPKKLIARGCFSETVQSVMSGSMDRPSDALAILDELAPFAHGRTIAKRVRAEAAKKEATTLSLLNELADAFAVSALDVLGTALLAMATGDEASVPLAARPHEKALRPLAARLRTAMNES